MNIKQIRDCVESVLADLLGSYTLPNGTIIPAVYVDGKYGVPKSWKVSGLEVAIKQYPLRRSRPLLAFVEMRMSWEIVLSHYSPSGEEMDKAINRLLRHYPDATLTGFPSSDREYQYARIIVPDLEIKTQY